MTEEDKNIAQFLDLSYRRRVLGQTVQPDSALLDDDKFVAALQAELSRIRGLGLGANLASRDFALYQHQQTIEAALGEIKRRRAAEETPNAPP